MEESFWGLIVNSGRRYEQVVEESFHVSKACLDPSGAGPKGHTTLFIDQGGEEFILTVLGANNLTDSLDLNFAAGNKICFRSVGPGTIHLTGYIMDDDEVMMGGEEEESESEEEDMPQLVEAGNKRKMTAMDKPGKKAKMENGKLTPLEKAMKSREEELKTAKNMQKKVAMEMEKITQQEDEDSDEDDSDYEDMDDEEDGEEEEDDDDEDDDDDDDEDEDDEDDDDDEEEEEDSDEEMEEVAKSPKKQEQKTPKKNEKSPKSNDKSPKSNEKTPKSNEKTPKKNEKTPSKEDKKTPKKSEQNGVDKKGDKTPSKAQQTPGKTPKTPKRMIKGGISVEDLVVGNGPEAKRNKFVGMYYEGRLASNKKVFDKKLGGEPFKFRLGAGEVIKGWDLGVEGMKVGGKRRLTIPAKMAYGSSGAPPAIPPNATLTFDVECKVVS